MAPPAFNFNVFMEKEKLATNGSNFTDWAMNLRILLTAAQNKYVLEAPLGPHLLRMPLTRRRMSIRLVRRTTT